MAQQLPTVHSLTGSKAASPLRASESLRKQRGVSWLRRRPLSRRADRCATGHRLKKGQGHALGFFTRGQNTPGDAFEQLSMQ